MVNNNQYVENTYYFRAKLWIVFKYEYLLWKRWGTKW